MNLIDLILLKTFIKVVELGNFRMAAEALNTTPSVISRRIEALEENLGYAKAGLLDRSGKHHIITDAGKVVLEYAERMLQLHREMVASVVPDPDAPRGSLQLGVAETIAHTWLTTFLQRMQTTYPLLTLVLDVDISVKLQAKLLSHELDLAFMVAPVKDDDLYSRQLNREPVSFLASRRLGLMRSTTLREIGKHPIITFSRDTKPYRNVRDLFDAGDQFDAGDRPRIHASASVATIVKMAVAGLGVAALPRSVAPLEMDSGGLIELSCEATLADLEFCAAWHTNRRVDQMNELVQIAVEVAAEHQAKAR